MARKPRIEIGGGLYHLITRGNNRRRIFRSHEDYLRLIAILEHQKSRLPFYLYAYCLMPNHLHLLVERRHDLISSIMQRVLTSYSQYHNRKYKNVGHVFQGRYKSILCQSDRYLGELVRYIHLNPVRAKIVTRPEEYEYSGHRAYVGMDTSGLVDAEPVLRHFGGTKRRAVEVYRRYVEAAMNHGSQEEYYRATEGRLLGSDKFVQNAIHRVGEVRRKDKPAKPLSVEELLKAAEKASGLGREELCRNSKRRGPSAIREAVIVIGRQSGIRNCDLAEALNIDPAAATRRLEAARSRVTKNAEIGKLLKALSSNRKGRS
jgi:REP element-mobilizing transposase RayT